MKIKLGLNTLNEIDNGKVAAAFDHELKHITRDCIDRATDNRPRIVTLEITVEPDPSDGVCDTVMASFKIKSKVPSRETKQYQLQAHANGSIFVNPESPDNVRQGTLDEVNAGD